MNKKHKQIERPQLQASAEQLDMEEKLFYWLASMGWFDNPRSFANELAIRLKSDDISDRFE